MCRPPEAAFPILCRAAVCLMVLVLTNVLARFEEEGRTMTRVERGEEEEEEDVN